MKHATVKLDGLDIPLIDLPPDATEQDCDACKKTSHLQDLAMTHDGRFLCQNCRMNGKMTFGNARP